MYCTNGHSQHLSIFVLRIAIAYEMNVSVLASHLNTTLDSKKGKSRLKYSLRYSIKIFSHEGKSRLKYSYNKAKINRRVCKGL